ILFVFFSLGVVAAALRYKETFAPKYLMLGAASLALLGATKETWIITAVVWLLALLCTAIYLRLRKRSGEELRPRRKARQEMPPEQPRARRNNLFLYANAGLLFVVIWVLFYSSFFTNFPQGVYDSVRTYTFWLKTSGNANVYSWTKYLEWLGKSEMAALVLGTLGSMIALVRARNRFAVFTAFWSWGILAAYSLLPYKTPWLALNIVLPIGIMGGYAIGQNYEHWTARLKALVVLSGAFVFSCYQAVNLSFFRYDDDTEPYSYAHSKRDLLNLVNEINAIAAGNPAGKDIGISVMSPEHWPLPWYLRDYTHAGYWGKVVQTTEPIVIAHENQIAEVQRVLGDKYREYSIHELRPGNRLVLYLRKDLQP
ncbi:MAG: flippase activity-associated protein Agl23, partial [Candidatus Angelobacter sp.]